MEVELKIRLPTEQDYKGFWEALLASGKPTSDVPLHYSQLNTFLQDTEGKLRKAKIAIRVRRETVENGSITDCHYYLTVKGGTEWRVPGVATSAESEQQISEQTAQILLSGNSDSIRSVFGSLDALAQHGIHLEIMKVILRDILSPASEWSILGQFSNERKTLPYSWLSTSASGATDLKIELDRTIYPTLCNLVAYEIEIEVLSAEIIISTVKQEMEEFLRKHRINFSYSKRGKLANMLAGSIE